MSDTERHQHPNYWAVWVWLLLLTVGEVLVAFISHIPKTVLILILLGLAVWKAALVALYFMHLKFEGNRMRIFAIAPLPLTVVIVIAVLTEFRW